MGVSKAETTLTVTTRSLFQVLSSSLKEAVTMKVSTYSAKDSLSITI